MGCPRAMSTQRNQEVFIEDDEIRSFHFPSQRQIATSVMAVPKNPTTSEFGQKLMELSEMPGFPQIARSRGKVRKFKIFFWILNILGFLYQTVQYVLIYRAYPVMLVIDIEYPDHLLHPGLTYCFLNNVDPGKFCNKYPERCENDWPKKEYLDYSKWMTREDYRELYISLFEMVRFNEATHLKAKLAWENTTIRMPFLRDNNRWMDCYIFSQQIFKLNNTPLTFPSYAGSLFGEAFVSSKLALLQYSGQSFTNTTENNILAIHSPYALVDPFKEGYNIEGTVIHLFGLIVKEYRSLPAPYVTNCRDYFQEWENNGEKGPLSREICIEECRFKTVFEKCHCFLVGILYPNEEEFCRNDDLKCADGVNVEHCYEDCRVECNKISYDVVTAGRMISVSNAMLMKIVGHLSLNADVDFSYLTDDKEIKSFAMGIFTPEKIVSKYIPKYSLIESFSYAGGYIGIWLGISFSSLMDLFGTMAQLFHHYYQSKKNL